MTLPSRVRTVQPLSGKFGDEKNSDESGNWHELNRIAGAFGYVNVDSPNEELRTMPPATATAGAASTHDVKLQFKFVRRDTGQPVTLSWMQFSVFDFDENDAYTWDNKLMNEWEGREVPPPLPRNPSRDPFAPNRPALTSPPHDPANPSRSALPPRDFPSTRSPAAP